MKKIISISLVLCFVFGLSACSKSNSTELTQATMDALYTSVAQTLSVMTQSAPAAETPTPIPTVTMIPTSTEPLVMMATSTQYVSYDTSDSCDSSTYVSDVTISDNTVLDPGEEFTKTWSIKNSGTCSWTTSYRIVFYSGSAMSGATTYLTSAVSSGHADNISVDMVAPTTAGTYTGYWIMQNASGEKFGQTVYVKIKVTSSYTSTPTGTITTTATKTSTPNLTATAYAATAYTGLTQTSVVYAGQTATALVYTATAIAAAATSTPVPTSTTAATSTPVPTETPVPTSTTEPTASGT